MQGSQMSKPERTSESQDDLPLCDFLPEGRSKCDSPELSILRQSQDLLRGHLQ